MSTDPNNEIATEEIPESGFQPVSHFVILCFFSLGIYPFFWLYKHWRYLRDEKKKDISPGFKTLFIIFTGYSLFGTFKKLARQHGYRGNPPVKLMFFLYTLMILISRIKEFPVVFYILGYFSFLFLIPALKTMNFYYLKEHENYKIKKKLGIDEIVFIIIIWLIVLASIFNSLPI